MLLLNHRGGKHPIRLCCKQIYHFHIQTLKESTSLSVQFLSSEGAGRSLRSSSQTQWLARSVWRRSYLRLLWRRWSETCWSWTLRFLREDKRHRCRVCFCFNFIIFVFFKKKEPTCAFFYVYVRLHACKCTCSCARMIIYNAHAVSVRVGDIVSDVLLDWPVFSSIIAATSTS